jgi:hypothetical protein
MTVVFPEAVKAQGATNVLVIPTMSDMAAPSLATDVGNAGTEDISNYLYGDFQPTATTNKGEAPRRLGSTQTFQQFGNTLYEVPDLTYVYDPTGSDAEANAAKDALDADAEVYLLIRRGHPIETAFAAAQVVDVWHVKLGPQNRGTTGDSEFDEYAITQSVVALEPPSLGVAIVT